MRIAMCVDSEGRPLLGLWLWKWGGTFRIYRFRMVVNGQTYSTRNRFINFCWD
jgi:hypothetical protein